MWLEKVSNEHITVTYASHLHKFCPAFAWPYQHVPYQAEDVLLILFVKLGFFLSPLLPNDSLLKQKIGLKCQLAGENTTS